MDPFIWCYVPFSPRAIPHLAKRIYGTKAPIEIEIRLTCSIFLIIFFDNAIRPNLATQSYLSLGSIMVHFDGYSVEFLSIPSHGNSIRESSPCLSLLSFGYWELRSLRWTSISLIRLCVCLYWAGGGGGAVPADALCFNRLLSCVFTSFSLLRHSRSNNLK